MVYKFLRRLMFFYFVMKLHSLEGLNLLLSLGPALLSPLRLTQVDREKERIERRRIRDKTREGNQRRREFLFVYLDSLFFH